MFAKIIQLILAIPSILGMIKDFLAMIRDYYLTKEQEKKKEDLKKHTDALEKAQQEGQVDAQKDALSSVIDDYNS